MRVLVRPALQLRDAFGHFRHGFFQLQNALLKGFCKISRTRRISCNNTKPNIGLQKTKIGFICTAALKPFHFITDCDIFKILRHDTLARILITLKPISLFGMF